MGASSSSSKFASKTGLKFAEAVDAFEVTLLKINFGLHRDVKFLFTYASPIDSPYTRSRTENILEKIETRYIDDGGYINMGDLNGKTIIEEDFVRDKYDKHYYYILLLHQRLFPTKWQNMEEQTTEEQGKIILSLGKNT